MKQWFGLALAAALLIAPLSAQQTELRPDSGVVNGSRYINGYFGVSYRFPDGWNGAASNRVAQAESQDAKYYALFTANPAAGGANEVRYIGLEADSASEAHSARDFAEVASRSLTGKQGQFDLLHEGRADYAGHSFYRLDMRSRPMAGSAPFLQTQLFTLERGYGIVFSFVAANKDDLEDLVRSVESLQFFKPGSVDLTALSTTKGASAQAVAGGPAAAGAASAPQTAAQPVPAAPAETDDSASVIVVTADDSKANSDSAPATEEQANIPVEQPSQAVAPAAVPASSFTGTEVAVQASSVPAQVTEQPRASKPVVAAKSAATKASQTVANGETAREVAEAQPAPRSAAIAQQPGAAVAIAPATQPAIRSTQAGRANSHVIPSAEHPQVSAALQQPLYGSSNAAQFPASQPVHTQSDAANPMNPPAVAEPTAATQPVLTARAEPAPSPVASAPMVTTQSLPAEQIPTRLRISPVSFQSYIVRTQALTYPPLAKQQRVQGRVTLKIVLDPSGHIAELSALSGPTLLLQGAMDGVKRWTFKPYLVDGHPIEVESQISMDYRLAQ